MFLLVLRLPWINNSVYPNIKIEKIQCEYQKNGFALSFCGLSCPRNEKRNSGSSGSNALWVQVPSSAPIKDGYFDKVAVLIVFALK